MSYAPHTPVGSMKAKELLSPDFDPHQPLPTIINLGWSAIEEHILRYHNHYFGQDKRGKVTPSFEDGSFTGVHVILDADDLQDERTLLYDPTDFIEAMSNFLHNQLSPGGRHVVNTKWHHNGTMPAICFRLAGTPVSKPTPINQEIPVPANRPHSKLEERFARLHAEHEATLLSQLSTSGDYVAFYVFEDSFGAFNATKKTVSELGLDYGWKPLKLSESPLSFGRTGTSPQIQ